MKKAEENERFMSDRATAEELFQELWEVVTDTFIATYERGKRTLIMRIPNGQKFRISVEETE